MAKRGRTPSLISAHGAVRRHESGKSSPCKRCESDIPKGSSCVRIRNASGVGHRTLCLDCFAEVIDQTRTDLEELRMQLYGAA